MQRGSGGSVSESDALSPLPQTSSEPLMACGLRGEPREPAWRTRQSRKPVVLRGPQTVCPRLTGQILTQAGEEEEGVQAEIHRSGTAPREQNVPDWASVETEHVCAGLLWIGWLLGSHRAVPGLPWRREAQVLIQRLWREPGSPHFWPAAGAAAALGRAGCVEERPAEKQETRGGSQPPEL